ncbi:hypothetical protein RGUI_4207 (plasmid) [Rhodovulum sp. P5]|uniref:hypothetical protein n=1 Tax=Rhodovulum sp. P5 TaxID=1564506 RepID=UPI0009C371B9|nr:hypothetical protein [Rhodovulum sp. P5]ARE42524.1 hypothetical protein RGUI_4207 [Rhodovulum sp. P5]
MIGPMVANVPNTHSRLQEVLAALSITSLGGEVEITAVSGEAVEITLTGTQYYDGTYIVDVALLEAGPVALVPPVIVESATPGTLTSVAGLWARSGPAPTLARQWLRDGVEIDGATDESFVTGTEDAGKSLQLRETVTDSNGSAEAVSNALLGPVPALIDMTVKPALIYPGFWQDNGTIAGGREFETVQAVSYRLAWLTETLGDASQAKSYRLVGTIQVSAAMGANSQLAIRNNMELGAGNFLKLDLAGAGPGEIAIDETFTVDDGSAAARYLVLYPNFSAAGEILQVYDFTLEELS